ELFLGRLRLDLIHPHPEPDAESEARAEEFLVKLRAFAENEVDPERIEREGGVAAGVLAGLRRMGAFGMTIPREYGGLGLNQRAYNRASSLLSKRRAALGVWLSAHQSTGVPQPIKMFGTEEQKKKYLARLAQ